MSRLESEPQWRPSDAYKATPPTELIEPDVFVDTWGIKLDHMLGIINGSEAYFAENPDQEVFTYIADIPSDDTKRSGQYAIQITPETLQAFKYATLGVYEDMRDHDPLAYELARDIHKSWQVPAEIELVSGEEAEL